MTLQSVRELENTRKKLQMLESRYDAVYRESGGDEHIRELTLRSLKNLINQLKEEIARFEAHRTTPAEPE